MVRIERPLYHYSQYAVLIVILLIFFGVFVYGLAPTMDVLTTGLSIRGLGCTTPIVIIGPYSIQVSQQEVQMPRDHRQHCIGCSRSACEEPNSETVLLNVSWEGGNEN